MSILDDILDGILDGIISVFPSPSYTNSESKVLSLLGEIVCILISFTGGVASFFTGIYYLGEDLWFLILLLVYFFSRVLYKVIARFFSYLGGIWIESVPTDKS